MKLIKKILYKLKTVIILSFAILIYLIVKENFFNNNMSPPSLLSKIVIEKFSEDMIQIEVLNGCGVKGVADLYTNFLRDKGYDVIDYKNANHFNYEQTQLIIYNTKLNIEDIISNLKIDKTNIKYIKRSDIFFDLSLIIGKDFNTLESFEEVSLFHDPFQ